MHCYLCSRILLWAMQVFFLIVKIKLVQVININLGKAELLAGAPVKTNTFSKLAQNLLCVCISSYGN